MYQKTIARTATILSLLLLVPVTSIDSQPQLASVCADVADDCKSESESICFDVDSALIDHARVKP